MPQKTPELPFAHFSLTQSGSNAASRTWQLDLILPGERMIKFFGLLIFYEGPAQNEELLTELVRRLQDTIRYHHQVMLSHQVSLTNEDFFEQCLQKANAEVNVFLRDVSQPLPVYSWAFTIGMLSADTIPQRWVIHLSRFGDINAWLVHKAQLDTYKLISIFDTPDPITGVPGAQKYFKNIVSSSVSDQDQVLFCSPNVFNYISLSDIKKVLTELSVPAAMRQLQNGIQEHLVDAIACASTLRLSPYKKVMSSLAVAANANEAAQSMQDLIRTQSKTEQLLGTGSTLGFASGLNWFKGLIKKILPPKAAAKLQPLARASSQALASIKPLFGFLRSKTPGKNPMGKSEYVGLHGTVAKVSSWRTVWRRISSPLARLFNKIFRIREGGGWKSAAASPRLWIFAAVLILFAVVGSRVKQHSDAKAATLAEAQVHMDTIRSTLDRIDSYLIVGREADAVALVQQTESMLDLVPTDLADFGQQKQAYITKLQDQQRRLRKEIPVPTPIILVSDLGTRLKAPPAALYVNGETMLIFGKDPHTYVAYDVPNNSPEERTVSTDLGTLHTAVLANPTTAVLVSGNTMASVDVTKTAPSASTTATANATSPFSAMNTYNNRLYGILPAEQQIMRSNTMPNFSVYSPWLKAKLPVLSLSRDIAIDGTIYVLMPDAMLQFNQGAPVSNFKLDAVDPVLADALALSYLPENKHFFVLEKSRLLVYKKNGKFVSQYLMAGDPTGVDVVVDEKKSMAYVLTTEQLLSFPLQLAP